MFEFTFTLGPLHIAWTLAAPSSDGGEYVDLADQYEVAEDTPEPDSEVGFRGTRR